MLSQYIKMSYDESPIVRKSVSKHLQNFIMQIPKAPEEDIMVILKNNFNDK